MDGHHHMVSVLIDSDAVNTKLTRELYDMIDSDMLVVRPSTFVRDLKRGSGWRKHVDAARDQPRKWIGGQEKDLNGAVRHSQLEALPQILSEFRVKSSQ